MCKIDKVKLNNDLLSISDVGEDWLIEWISEKIPRKESVFAGIGDDCANVKTDFSNNQITLKIDSIVEGIHFLREHPARWVGWKAMARPLSDFAAAGAIPKFALIAISLPRSLPIRKFIELYSGLIHCSKIFGVEIVGGETTESKDAVAITVSIIGKGGLGKRKNCKLNDEIFVTGTLGGSYLTGKHLRFKPRIEEAQWLYKNFSITSMMDISDGLAQDLPRLIVYDHFRFTIFYDQIPIRQGFTLENALTDGEDYELLFTVSKSNSEKLLDEWNKKFPFLRLTKIGFVNNHGDTKLNYRGFEHFKSKK